MANGYQTVWEYKNKRSYTHCVCNSEWRCRCKVYMIPK